MWSLQQGRPTALFLLLKITFQVQPCKINIFQSITFKALLDSTCSSYNILGYRLQNLTEPRLWAEIKNIIVACSWNKSMQYSAPNEQSKQLILIWHAAVPVLSLATVPAICFHLCSTTEVFCAAISTLEALRRKVRWIQIHIGEKSK